MILNKSYSGNNPGVAFSNYYIKSGNEKTWLAPKDSVSVKKAFGDTYAEYLDVSFEKYADVINDLESIGITGAADAKAALKGANYLGISNWCKRSVEESVCDLPSGFKATVGHTFVYWIAKDPKDLAAGCYDAEFTFGLDGKTEFPTTAVSKWTKTQVNTWKNDLLFVQFLKDNKATTIALVTLLRRLMIAMKSFLQTMLSATKRSPAL